MKQLLVLSTAVFLLTGCKKDSIYTNLPASPAENNTQNSGYKLAWSDEFNYTGLPDPLKWGYEHGYVRNNEKQYYEEARLENSEVNNGLLIITARNDNYNSHAITSASVITKDRMQFLYGKIEVSARMPIGAGSWPAIWTLGVNREKVDWPNCGEIDIAEWVGRSPRIILGSMYMPGGLLGYTAKITTYDVGNNTTLSAQFHTYSIEWDSTQIKYFYDGYNYATYKASGLTAKQWAPFMKPQYLLLDLAIGGTSGGPVDDTKFPFTYEVDYVRYYQKK
ncbi:MAG TPA: glycoside hydrolase family 16 protein [Parafilimonas sp.]|nr:glycoside hydrolase family 16 protein [Parafilimonas sp.]